MKSKSQVATKRTTAKKNEALKKSKASRGGLFQQWLYGWRDTLTDMLRRPLATLLTVMVIAISLTLPSIFYIIWKNVSYVSSQWYPTPQLTAYLDKSLDDNGAEKVIVALKAEAGVERVNYLSRQEALEEFRSWSGFGGALDMLGENPLPAVAIITPKIDFQSRVVLNSLRDRIVAVSGVDEVRMDESWFARLTALTGFIGEVAMIIAVLMIAAVFLVIGNSVRLNIFSRRETINVMKLIGATDGFILRPFLYGGALIGFAGALLSSLLSQAVTWKLSSLVASVANIFGSQFILQTLGWDEGALLLLMATMIGWFAAWLATVQHLRQFSPQ